MAGAFFGGRLRLPDVLGFGGPLAAVAIALWLTGPAWSDGLPNGDDVYAHLIRTGYGLEHIVGRGRLDGWQPTFVLGYQQFLFMGPLFTWLVGLVRFLSFDQLSVMVAFKATMVASFAALPLAVSFLARSFGLDRRAAGVAALLSLTLFSFYGGVGLQSAFAIGLIVNQLGAVLFCLAVGGVLRILADPRAGWVLFTAAVVALLVVTHGISVILLGALVPVVLLLVLVQALVLRDRLPAAAHSRGRQAKGVRPRPSSPALSAGGVFTDMPPLGERAQWFRALRALGAAVSLGFLLAAFILLPVAAHRNLRGEMGTAPFVPLGQRLADVGAGRILLRPGIALLLVLGWGFALRHVRRNPFVLALVATPLAFLALGEVFRVVWPTHTVTYQLPNRGLGYAGIVAVLPAAAFVVWAAGRLFEDLHAVVALAVTLFLVVLPIRGDRALAHPPRIPPVMQEAAARLRAVVPDGARFVMLGTPTDQINLTGMYGSERWFAWASGRNTLNSFNTESSVNREATRLPAEVSTLSPDEAADRLARYGVTHALLLSSSGAGRMLSSPRFSSEWSSPPLAILAVHPRPGQPSPASLLATSSPASARLVRTDPEHLRIAVDAERATSATVAVGWSPKWHARLDGEPVPLGRTSDGLLEVRLPAGRSTLALDFRSDGWDRLGVALSSTTGAGLVAWGIRRRLRGRLSRPPDSPAAG